MSSLLKALAFVLGAAATALPATRRAFGAGVPWWYGGLGWYGGTSRHMPAAARPHARRAMKRWVAAMGLLALAAASAIAAEGLAP